MKADQKRGCLQSLGRQIVQGQEEGAGHNHEKIGGCQDSMGQQDQFFGIGNCLIGGPRAHALTDNGNHGGADGGGGDQRKLGQGVGNGVCRCGAGSETGHNTQHQQLSDLENAVFHAAWHTDGKQLFNNREVKAQGIGAQGNFQSGVAQQDQKHSRSQHPGYQGRDRHAGGAHMETIHQQGVSTDIHKVHEQGGQHGDPGISHGAEDSGAGVIDRQERIGKRHDEKVNPRAFHDVQSHVSKNQVKDPVISGQRHKGHDQGHGSRRQQKLLGGKPRLLIALRPEIL